MLDIKKIRNFPKEIENKLKTKDPSIDISSILEIDEQIRNTKTSVEALKSKRNSLSKEIGIKKRKNEDIEILKKNVDSILSDINELDEKLKVLEQKIQEKLEILPNIPMDDIPISLDPKDNVCINTFKTKKEFTFKIKNHLELNEKLQLFDLTKSAKTTGSGWPLYKNLGARLEWALLNYMLDTHIKNGFIQIMPPLLVKEDIMYGSGQLPKFEDQLFKLNDKDHKLYLIPTAEVVLNGLNYHEILDKENLPLKYVAYTPCFRREAGAAGKNERGLIRTHQFNKVELFCITTPEKSNTIFEFMLKSAEEILQGLNLHYRAMLLTTGDMSFAAAKTIDLEVWLPGQDRYYEVSSISNCTDYQARRAQIRYRDEDNKPQFVHCLNGSGVATSRLMIALLENNQREDGSIEIPKVLHKYLENEITVLK